MSEHYLRREGPTWLALVLAYGVWALATSVIAGWSLLAGIMLAGIAAALHSSLTHELLHGHPTRWPWLNALLAAPALSLFIPYLRFRDTHLAHHDDDRLTDPYDDPESNYLDPARWARLPGVVKLLLRINNTLAGRIVLGPAIGLVSFAAADLRAMLAGDRRVALGWLLHIPAVAVVVWWAMSLGQMPLWAYLAQAYIALGLLKIRTFLEHRASDRPEARTVIIEKPCPLAWLFLFNSLHVVHHRHPGLPWHQLPAAYRARRDYYRKLNGGYVYGSYGEVFRAYLFHAKDPVSHPLWPKP